MGVTEYKMLLSPHPDLPPQRGEGGKADKLRRRAFNGSHYDMGFQLGRSLSSFELPSYSQQQLEFAYECRELVKHIYSPIIDKFEGLLAGSQLDKDAFTVYFFARERGILRGCTIFAILPSCTKTGQIIVGRNYDWVYSDLKYCELWLTNLKDAFPTISYTHHWAGGPDVLNDHGLCVMIASLPAEKASEPGLQWNAIVDFITERCCNVDQARRFIVDVPHLRSMSYLIVDKEGNAIAVETVPGSVMVREPESGYIVVTNHCVDDHPGMDSTSRGMSLTRYRRTEQLIEKRLGTIDVEYTKEILRDHEGFICSGDHEFDPESPQAQHQWGTIWSTICLPQTLKLIIAPGHPCQAEYQEVTS